MVVVTSAVCLVLALVSVVVRTYVRYELSPHRLSWDDGLVVAALVCRSTMVGLQILMLFRCSMSCKVRLYSGKLSRGSAEALFTLLDKT
jgi:hypothetical protein